MCFILSSCEYSEEFKVHESKHVSLEIPSYMDKTNRLSTEAIMQFQNRFRNLYAVVLQKNKKPNQDLEKVTYESVKLLKSRLTNGVVEQQYAINLSGRKAIRCFVSGEIDERPFAYEMVIMEGENHFFELTIWTTQEKFNTFGTDIEKIITTFKEL